MEDHRRALQPDADDDGDAAAPHHSPAQDDAGPWHQEGDGGDAGENERPVAASWHVRDADQFVGRSPGSGDKEEGSSEKTTTAMSLK